MSSRTPGDSEIFADIAGTLLGGPARGASIATISSNTTQPSTHQPKGGLPRENLIRDRYRVLWDIMQFIL